MYLAALSDSDVYLFSCQLLQIKHFTLLYQKVVLMLYLHSNNNTAYTASTNDAVHG